MWEFLQAALPAIPSAASSPYAFGAYALAVLAYVLTVWRVARNKTLLENLQKLPSKDRLSALEIETGGVRLAAGISPEQWVRSRIHRYYLFAFLGTCVVAVATAAVAAWNGATYVKTLTIVNNEYYQSNNGEPLSSSDLQHIKELVEAVTTRDSEQARTALNQLSEKARAAYESASVKHNLPSIDELNRAGAAYAADAPTAPGVAPTKPPEPYFSDEFKNPTLSDAWQVDNPSPSNFVVESGHLLVIAHAAGGLSNANSQNVFRLLKPVPESDWTITAKLTVKLQTEAEDFQIGLIDDTKNYLVAQLYPYDYAGESRLAVQVSKASSGVPAEFHLDARTGGGGFGKFRETITQPISVRLIKKGYEYRAAVNFAGDVDKSGNPVWSQTSSVTSLRSPKTFVMNASQRYNVTGESTFYIHSVKIEALP